MGMINHMLGGARLTHGRTRSGAAGSRDSALARQNSATEDHDGRGVRRRSGGATSSEREERRPGSLLQRLTSRKASLLEPSNETSNDEHDENQRYVSDNSKGRNSGDCCSRVSCTGCKRWTVLVVVLVLMYLFLHYLIPTVLCILVALTLHFCCSDRMWAKCARTCGCGTETAEQKSKAILKALLAEAEYIEKNALRSAETSHTSSEGAMGGTDVSLKEQKE